MAFDHDKLPRRRSESELRIHRSLEGAFWMQGAEPARLAPGCSTLAEPLYPTLIDALRVPETQLAALRQAVARGHAGAASEDRAASFDRRLTCLRNVVQRTAPYPTDWDHWKDRDEAAWYLFATTAVTVAPTEECEARIQTVIFDEYPDLVHTVFWHPRAAYEALLADIERAYDTPFPSELRLDELPPGPLVEFLRHELPRASLSDYKREILCLDPTSAPSA